MVKYTSLDEIPFRPFCSERCKMVDLGKWLNEEYKISEPLDGVDAQDPPPPEHRNQDGK
jgi:endogenous inhibitor of DNA gyrase (YacG/DUF329 family)